MEKIELPGLIEDNSKHPAYPTSYAYDSEDGITKVTHFGLSKREYFAGLAMQAFIQKEGSIDRLLNETTANGNPTMREQMAKASIKCADELLKQLQK